jgi:glycosidase
MFNFPQKYRGIDPVFAQDQPTKNLECLFNSRMGRNPTDAWCMSNRYSAGPTYPAMPHAASDAGGVGLAPNALNVNFLDNHDLPRFLFEKADERVLTSALGYLFTWDGIPCIYYGTEQQFAGGVDPKNREDMFRGNEAKGFAPFATDHAAFQRVKALIQMRKDHVALRRGTISPTWSTTVAGPRRDAGIFAFERSVPGAETLLVVLNTSAQDSESCAPTTDGGACMKTTLPAGSVLKDIMPGSDGKTFTVKSDGTVAVTVPPRSGRVLAKQ